MKIFPAIDIYGGRAVRLLHGDYDKMTDYGDPAERAKEFVAAGVKNAHIVDLEGAKTGLTPNLSVIERIAANTPLFIEVGGGIRNMEAARRYIDAGAGRIILGTAALTDPGFLQDALSAFGGKVAVGADLRDGYIAVKGWTETSAVSCGEFFTRMAGMGVKTVICTDISKDGALKGANVPLYRELAEKYPVNIIASGGVSSTDDIKQLAAAGVYGAIIGKAYYTGAVELKSALRAADDN